MDGLYAALGDPTRREVLRLLRGGDMSAGEISSRFTVSKSTLSGHLRTLREAGLVVTERRGTTIIYSLNQSVYEELVESVMDVLGVEEVGRRVASEGRRIEDAR